MKNPFLSAWLSAANRAIGVGRGLAAAEMRKRQTEAAKAMAGGGAAPKRKAAKPRRKAT
jgi:hypothetical protein